MRVHKIFYRKLFPDLNVRCYHFRIAFSFLRNAIQFHGMELGFRRIVITEAVKWRFTGVNAFLAQLGLVGNVHPLAFLVLEASARQAFMESFVIDLLVTHV